MEILSRNSQCLLEILVEPGDVRKEIVPLMLHRADSLVGNDQGALYEGLALWG